MMVQDANRVTGDILTEANKQKSGTAKTGKGKRKKK